MCKKCVYEVYPDRGACCLDEGHYIINLKACHHCGQRNIPVVANRVEETEVASCDEDIDHAEDVATVMSGGGRIAGGASAGGCAGEEETEEVTFQHVCPNCGHVIAEHFYRAVENPRGQTWLMECMLCGRGVDRRGSVVEQVRQSAGTAGAGDADAEAFGSSEAETVQLGDGPGHGEPVPQPPSTLGLSAAFERMTFPPSMPAMQASGSADAASGGEEDEDEWAIEEGDT